MIHCNLCWLEFNHQMVYEQHLSSRNHTNAAEFQKSIANNSHLTQFYCDTCSLYTNSQAILDFHLASDNHRTKMKLKLRLNSISDRSLKTVTQIKFSQTVPCFTNLTENITESEWCHCCFCQYNSPAHKFNHLNGQEHKRKLEIKESNNKNDFLCAYCAQKPTIIEQLKIHLNSKNHLDQVRRYELYYEANKHLKQVTYIDSSTNLYSTDSSDDCNQNIRILAQSDSFNDSLYDFLCISKSTSPASSSSANDSEFEPDEQITVNSIDSLVSMGEMNSISKNGIQYFKHLNKNPIPSSFDPNRSTFEMIIKCLSACEQSINKM